MKLKWKIRDLSVFAIAFSVLALTLILPTPEGLSRSGFSMLGLLFMAMLLWIMEPIPLSATALLVMVLQALLNIRETSDVFSSFGNKAVFFLIGTFIITAGLEAHNVHKRFALRFLHYFGNSPRQMTFGIFFISMLLPFGMPEHGVVALLMPITVQILVAMKLIPGQSNFGKVCMLSIGYGATIGSLATLMGGARNPLTIGFLKETQGIDVSFLEWIRISLPIVLISGITVWYILYKTFPLEDVDLTKAKEFIVKDVRKLGPMTGDQLKVIGIFIITVVGWVFFSHIVGLAVIALIGAVLMFLTEAVSWEDVESRMHWGIILLYGGAITMGVSLKETGAAAWIADQFMNVVGTNELLIILILIIAAMLLTQAMSNAAAVATLLPIGLGIALEAGLPPLMTSMLIGLSGGLAFMFVIATPGYAITYSSGYYSMRDLLKAGVLANIACIIIVFLVATTYWRYIGVW